MLRVTVGELELIDPCLLKVGLATDESACGIWPKFDEHIEGTGVGELAEVGELELMARMWSKHGAYLEHIACGVLRPAARIAFLVVVIEHYTIAYGEEQGATPVVELQVDIMVKDVIGAFLVECQTCLVELVDAIVLYVIARFDARHHLQSFEVGDGCVEFEQPGGQVVAIADDTMFIVTDGKLFQRIVFTGIGKHSEQLGTQFVEGVEPPRTDEEHLLAQVFAEVFGRCVGVLVALVDIGANNITIGQPVCHLGVQILLILVDALDVGAVELGIDEDVGVFVTVTDVGGSAELMVGCILQGCIAVSIIFGLTQIDVDDAALARTTLGDTRVVANLYFLDDAGLDLRHQQAAVARDGHIVETQLVAAQQIVIAADEQFGIHLKDAHQRLVALKVESPRIDDGSVGKHLDGRQLFPMVTPGRSLCLQRWKGREGGEEGEEGEDVNDTPFHNGIEDDYTGAKIISFAENSKQM